MNALICAVVAVVVAAAPAKPAKPVKPVKPLVGAPVIEVLEDGTTLVFRHVPGARVVSMRYVVRSGGEADPPGKAGLAHLLEHLIFHGTYEEPEGTIFNKAWDAGANVNAFTSGNWTTYVLDVPATSFASTATSMLAAVTAPALPFASIDREKGVVSAEDADRPDMMSIFYALDQMLFPSHNGGLTVIGTEESRASITLDDLQEFHARHYVPQNSVFVVAGDLALDDVKAVAAAGLHSPPSIEPLPAPETATPNTPTEAKGGSYVTVTAHAHVVDGAARGACDAAAGLLELRLRRRVIAVERIVASVYGACVRDRGHDLIVLAVVTSSPDSSQLPDWLNEVYRDGTRVPPTAAEKLVVESRRRALLTQATSSAAGFADAVMMELYVPDVDVKTAVSAVTAPPPLVWSTVTAVITKSAAPDQTATLHFSRFER